MNCMKKTSKIFLVSIVIILVLLTIIIFVLTNKNHHKMEILTIPNDYYIVNNNTIVIPMYSNIKNNPYLSIENIKKTYLFDNNHNDLYQLEIINIITTNELYRFNNLDYYLYELNINIPFSTDEDLLISNSILKINYLQEELNLPIGNFYISHEKENDNLSYSSLKGYTTKINNKTILKGVLIKLNTNNNITINKIRCINNQVGIDTGNIILTNNPNNININNDILIGNNELFLDQSINIMLSHNEANYLYVPLKYNEYVELPIVMFKINYEENNQNYELLVKPFQYYSKHIEEKDVIKTIINND